MCGVRDLVLFHAALADTTRLRLLALMQGGEICVCHLQGVLDTNQPKISRHLAYLRRAGLVASRREGKWMHYRLKPQAPTQQTALDNILQGLAGETQIRKDQQRLQQLRGEGSRFSIRPTKCC
ncbi:MAG TPA: metalloregulator ArsR/SmtB family transcription factor [Verrucomicrobiae bacterium]